MKLLHVIIVVLLLILLASCGNDDEDNQGTFQNMDELYDYIYGRDWVFDVYLEADSSNRSTIYVYLELLFTNESLHMDDDLMVMINGTRIDEYLYQEGGHVEVEFEEAIFTNTSNLHILAKYNGQEIFNRNVNIPDTPSIANVVASGPDEKVRIFWSLEDSAPVQIVAFSAYDGDDDDDWNEIVSPESRSITIPANTFDVSSFYRWYAHVGTLNYGEQGSSTFFVSCGDDEDNYQEGRNESTLRRLLNP